VPEAAGRFSATKYTVPTHTRGTDERRGADSRSIGVEDEPFSVDGQKWSTIEKENQWPVMRLGLLLAFIAACAVVQLASCWVPQSVGSRFQVSHQSANFKCRQARHFQVFLDHMNVMTMKIHEKIHRMHVIRFLQFCCDYCTNLDLSCFSRRCITLTLLCVSLCLRCEFFRQTVESLLPCLYLTPC
jgi:hypothetical protein